MIKQVLLVISIPSQAKLNYVKLTFTLFFIAAAYQNDKIKAVFIVTTITGAFVYATIPSHKTGGKLFQLDTRKMFFHNSKPDK